MFTTTDFDAYPQVLPSFDQVVADENLQQRLVDQIHEACWLLMQLDGLKVCEINVTVTNGRVALSGNVECSRLRRLAESLAEAMPDVISVTSQIRIAGEPPAATTKRSPIQAGSFASMMVVGSP